MGISFLESLDSSSLNSCSNCDSFEDICIYIYFLSYGLYKFLLICSTWSSPGSYDPSMANLPVQDSIPYEGEY